MKKLSLLIVFALLSSICFSQREYTQNKKEDYQSHPEQKKKYLPTYDKVNGSMYERLFEGWSNPWVKDSPIGELARLKEEGASQEEIDANIQRYREENMYREYLRDQIKELEEQRKEEDIYIGDKEERVIDKETPNRISQKTVWKNFAFAFIPVLILVVVLLYFNSLRILRK